MSEIILDGLSQRNLRLRLALNQPTVLRWTEDKEIESAYYPWTPVKLTWLGETLFQGRLKSQVANLEAEEIDRQAVDAWEYLNTHILKLNNSYQVEWNNRDKNTQVKTCGEIIQEIFNSGIIPSDVISGIVGADLLDVKPPYLRYEGAFIADVLLDLLKFQQDVVAYINQSTKELTFQKLDSGEIIDTYLGEEGQTIKDQYNILRQGLNYSLEGVYTRAVLLGEEVVYEVEETLQRAWDANLEATWTPELAQQNPSTYGRVYRVWKGSHQAWLNYLANQDGTLSNDGPKIIDADGYECPPSYIDYENGEIWYPVRRRITSINFQTGITWEYGVLPKEPLTGTYTYKGKKFTYEYSAQDGEAVSAGYTAEPAPFQGYGLRQVIKNGQVVRDDTAEAKKWLRNYVERHKNLNLKGTITIDTKERSQDIAIRPGKKLRIRNSKGDALLPRLLLVMSVEYNFSENTALVEVMSEDNLFYEMMLSLRNQDRQIKEARRRIDNAIEQTTLAFSFHRKKADREELDNASLQNLSRAFLVVHSPDETNYPNTIITDLANPPRQSSLNLVLAWDPNESDPLNDPSRPGAWKAVAIYKPAT